MDWKYGTMAYGGSGAITAYSAQYTSITVMNDTRQTDVHRQALNAANTVPVANKNQPRAWGALACVYLGAPR